MINFETVRSRFFYRSLDAAMTAPLRADRGFASALGSVLSPRSTRYVRVASLANLCYAALPGLAGRVSRFILQPQDLPFVLEPLRLLDYGSGSTVFYMETDQGQWVLKIYRRSLGRSCKKLATQASEYEARYETVLGWYGADVVWPANFLILHGPILGSPAVACIQSYIGEEKRDLFLDFSDTELRDLLEADPILKMQFVRFARTTLHVYMTKDRCVDFLGRGNCLLIREGGPYRIRVIDYGIFDMAKLKYDSVSAFCRAESRVTRLRGLLKKLAYEGMTHSSKN